MDISRNLEDHEGAQMGAAQCSVVATSKDPCSLIVFLVFKMATSSRAILDPNTKAMVTCAILACNNCMQFLQRSARIAGNSKVTHAKIAHVTIALVGCRIVSLALANCFASCVEAFTVNSLVRKTLLIKAVPEGLTLLAKL